jgi:hypothetical protein
MACGFPDGDGSVMTLRTTAWHNSVVCKKCGLPIGRSVTTITIDGGWNVIRGFKRGRHPPARRVALKTLRGCSPKDALQMAALALDLRMTAGERKAGGIVIDFDVRAVASLSLALVWKQDP